MTNAPVYGCPGCTSTGGMMACPYHGPQAIEAVACSTGYCRCAAKDRRIAELEADLMAIATLLYPDAGYETRLAELDQGAGGVLSTINGLLIDRAALATERARWLRVNHSDANSTLSKGDFDAAREKE